MSGWGRWQSGDLFELSVKEAAADAVAAPNDAAIALNSNPEENEELNRFSERERKRKRKIITTSEEKNPMI